MKKLDGLDSEAIRDMQRSRGWALFMERLTYIRGRNVDSLIHGGDTENLRGMIMALDMVKTIPDTIVSEIKSKGGKHG